MLSGSPQEHVGGAAANATRHGKADMTLE